MSDEVGVFTSEQVLRLTGISRQKLAYWLRQEVIVADIDEAKGRGRVRLFSFGNLVEIRTALWLRDKISLQLIRKIVTRLRAEEGKSPLSAVTFGIVEDQSGRRPPHHDVVLQRDDGTWERWQSGQKVMDITVPLHRFTDELRALADKDQARRRRVGKVERRRGVLGSTPVVAGTRVPTRAIWSLHAAGYDVERIIRNYPGLTKADVKAALAEEQRRRGAASA